MEVILLERVEKLGLMGDVVNVKPGYARNYLLPKNKAISATATNKKQFENKRNEYEATNLKTKNEAENIGKKLDGNLVTMVRQAGENGNLYGSVNARDVADGLVEIGYNVNRSQISLERPIKTVGLHLIKVALHPEVVVTVTANVARSEDEAKLQEKTGEAIIAAESETENLVTAVLAEADARETMQKQKPQDVQKGPEEDLEETSEETTDIDITLEN
ncbi:50S ribosomal protein L9 [Rhodospirillales bacterium]|nr:50S ribosomal protein L9 [Rhodospirillales bacterium]